MYESFYGMSHTPFGKDIPAERLYESRQIQDAIGRLTERVDADLVQVIGRNGLLFKRNFKKPQIEFLE